MLIDWTVEFDRWLDRLENAGGLAAELVTALLVELENMEGPPLQETVVIKRVRQARRHELWRLAHAFQPDVAIRILVWFPEAEQVVIALVGFDKAQHGDVWYSSAAIRAEEQIDQWLRDKAKDGDGDDRSGGRTTGRRDGG